MRIAPRDKGADPPGDERSLLRALGRAGVVLGILLVAVTVVGSIVVGRVPGVCGSCHDPQIRDSHAGSAHAPVLCVECHTPHRTFLGLSGMVHSVGGAVMPSATSRSSMVAVPDAACLACHAPEAILEVVVSRGVRMSHAALSDNGYACVDCHESLVHGTPEGKLAVPTMGMCTKCHNGRDVSAACATCHPERAADDGDRLRDAEWGVTHGTGWEQAHGLGDLTTCVICHEPSKCEGCHGVLLPHPVDFGIVHGGQAIAIGASTCRTCHTSAFCASCHGIEMPHPDGFLPSHSKVAAGLVDGRCMVCHVPANCNECHERHTHPAFNHRLRPPTNMYDAAPR